MILTILAVVVGFVLGILLRMTNPGEQALMWIGNICLILVILSNAWRNLYSLIEAYNSSSHCRYCY